MDWLDLFVVQVTLKSLIQHHSSKASILQHSAFFMVQLSQAYMTTRKNIALTQWTFVSKTVKVSTDPKARTANHFFEQIRIISFLFFPSPDKEMQVKCW